MNLEQLEKLINQDKELVNTEHDCANWIIANAELEKTYSPHALVKFCCRRFFKERYDYRLKNRVWSLVIGRIDNV